MDNPNLLNFMKLLANDSDVQKKFCNLKTFQDQYDFALKHSSQNFTPSEFQEFLSSIEKTSDQYKKVLQDSDLTAVVGGAGGAGEETEVEDPSSESSKLCKIGNGLLAIYITLPQLMQLGAIISEAKQNWDNPDEEKSLREQNPELYDAQVKKLKQEIERLKKANKSIKKEAGILEKRN